MALTRTSNARKIGRYAAEQLKDQSDVVGIWARQDNRTVEIWILVDTSDLDRERSVRSILWELFDRFPDSYIDLQVSNIQMTDVQGLQHLVPENATRVGI